MGADFVKAMEEEIEGLERELKADPRYVKIQELKRIRRLYGEAESGDEVVANSQPRPIRQRTRIPSAERVEILAVAASIVRGRTTPTTTAKILDEIVAQGLEVRGASPRNTLSAMLSNAEEFETHGRSGWTLREPDKPAQNAEAADGHSSPNEPSTASDQSRSDEPGSLAALLAASRERR